MTTIGECRPAERDKFPSWHRHPHRGWLELGVSMPLIVLPLPHTHTPLPPYWHCQSMITQLIISVSHSTNQADYFTIGLRRNAFLTVAPQVASASSA